MRDMSEKLETGADAAHAPAGINLSAESITGSLGSEARAARGRGRRPVISEDLRDAAKDAGLNTRALAKLSEEGLRDLAVLLSAGSLHARVAVSALNAVYETSRGKENRLLHLLAAYQPRMDILAEFLQQMGTNDPFRATARAQVRMLAREDLPQEQRGGVRGVNAGESAPGPRREGVRGVSGHLLGRADRTEDVYYTVFDPDSPATSVGFFGRRQAVLGPFEYFAPEKFSEPKQRAVRERRFEALRSLLADLTVADLESHPELVESARSPLLTSKWRLYQELQQVIATYKSHVDALTYGDSIQPSRISAFHVRADVGGSLFGWFQRRIDAGEELPGAVRQAFAALTDPCVHLSPAEERFYSAALLAHARLHSYMDKNVALAGISGDLAAFDALPADDPLRELADRVNAARQRLQEKAAGGSDEMRVTEFAEVLEQTPLLELRRAMNARCLELYRADFMPALDRFAALFAQDGRVREDSLQESVPMERLSKTVYGAPLAMLGSYDKTKKPLFAYKEFRALKDALFLDRVCAHNEDRLLSAMPIQRFHEMVEHVVIAYRKASALEPALGRHLEQAAAAGNAISLNREDIGESLAAWRPVLPAGSGLRPLETLSGERERAAGGKRPLVEVWRCACEQRLLEGALSGERARISAAIAAGLYPKEQAQHLIALRRRTAGYTDISRIPAETVANARKVLDSPLIVLESPRGQDLLKQRYFSAAEARTVQRLAAFAPQAQALGLIAEPATPAAARLDAAAAIRQTLHGASFYVGALARGERPELRFEYGRGEHVEAARTRDIGHYDIAELEQAAKRLEREWVRADQLPPGWVQKLTDLARRYGNREALQTARGLVASDKRYISRALVEAVEQCRPAAAPSTAALGDRLPIGPSRHFVWKEAAGQHVPCFAFGKYNGRPIAEVAAEVKRSRAAGAWDYFTRFMQKDFPDHAKEIALKIAVLGGRPGAFPEREFTDWLKAEIPRWSKR